MAFVDGELPDAEQKAIENAARSDSSILDRLEAFRMSGEALNVTYRDARRDPAPDAILERIAEFETVQQGTVALSLTKYRWLAAAASVAVIASATAIGIDVYRYAKEQVQTTVASSEPGGLTPPESDAEQLVAGLDSPPPPDTAAEVIVLRAESTATRIRLHEDRELADSITLMEAYQPNESEYMLKEAGSPARLMRLPAMEPGPTEYERYQGLPSGRLQSVKSDPVSTFSIDVDTGSYANVRRFLNSGRLPPAEAVRVEELINYFSYEYPIPENPEMPFGVTTEVARTFWNPDTHLLRIGLKGYEVERAARPNANLVFLIDVSGSMQDQQKLPLLISAMKLLVSDLDGDDRISIVTYAGESAVALEGVRGDEKVRIVDALDQLQAGGSTAGGAGIRRAYRVAETAMIDGGINRVILATDGDFNVGVTDIGALKDLISEKRETGISLTTLGFGAGNYKEALMEQIADVGNGNYAYIDTLREAKKVLVEELTSTLFTIASDVKIQIEFNPAVVANYRLIGYENRALRREEFNDDQVDAGEIGAGHSVTALYEIALVGSEGLQVAPLRYVEAPQTPPGNTDELAFIRLRYKLPGEPRSRLLELPAFTTEITESDKAEPSPDMRFAIAVAAFGQILNGNLRVADFTLDDAAALARDASGDDPNGYRAEFVSLAEMAGTLMAHK
jgi:Ca-activated chloride channel family protein